jgi:hypothetical protein
MKKIILLILCLTLLVLTGCDQQYKRISFDSDTLGETLSKYIDENTKVTNISKEKFSTQIPIYKISERKISQYEYDEMFQQLGISDGDKFPNMMITFEGNKIVCTLASYVNSSRGYYNMTDEEVEKEACEILQKLPFIDGNYEYVGVNSSMTVQDSEGTHILRASVHFRKVVDGIRVLGNDRCVLEFDGSGLVGFTFELYEYEKVGTMDVIPLESAAQKIKNPDAFTINEEEAKTNFGIATILNVERVSMRFYNQYSRGCEILQPVYGFIGTATDSEGVQTEFNSKIIAIPDSYTYE